jgi:Tol biopolymer transport system component
MGDQSELGEAERAQAPSGDASQFWARVREHKIIQWGVGYLGAALALAHGQELVGHALQWPDLLGRVVVILLIVGFPIALTLAWYQGHRGLTRVSAGELMITSLLMLIGAVFFTVALRPDVEHAAAETARGASTDDSAESPRVNDGDARLDALTRTSSLRPAVVTRFLVTPPATAPLANQGGWDLAISPDGMRLVYVARDLQSGGSALYSRELDSIELRAIPGTEVASGGNMNPFFSADGAWIGFGSPGRGIMRVAVGGGSPLKIVDHPEQFGGATWGADDTLIFSSLRGLHRVSAGGGGTPEQLTTTTEDPVLQVAPELLPGGRAVLFEIADRASGVHRVAVLDLQSREQKIVIEAGSDASYAPTGHLVFVRDGTLLAAPFDVQRLAVTGDPVVLLQGIRDSLGQAADLDLSATGTLVYVPADDGAARSLVWVDRSGRSVSRAVDELLNNPRSPRLSPSDQQVALVSGSGNDVELWIHSLDGRPALRLNEGNNAIPAWSHDGREVVFGWNRRGNEFELYALPSDGSGREPRLVGPSEWNARPAAWLAGGKLLVQRITGNDVDIVEISAGRDGAVDELVASDDLEYHAALSPNGRWLAYVSNRTGEHEIWVQAYPKGVAQRVTRGGQAREPVWSRDGEELFYLRANTMMAVDVETEGEFSFGPSRELFNEPYILFPNVNVRFYDVARDGRFLMMQSATLWSILVVQNWFAELERRAPAQ